MFVMAKPGAKPRPEEKSKEALMLHLERSSMAKDGWNLQFFWVFSTVMARNASYFYGQKPGDFELLYQCWWGYFTDL